jgi:TnpA family transposase
VRTLDKLDEPHSFLARALAEYGRIGKTLHLLDLVIDEVYRRSLLVQVNTGERRHGPARRVFHGRLGELRAPNDPAEQVFDLIAATA